MMMDDTMPPAEEPMDDNAGMDNGSMPEAPAEGGETPEQPGQL